MIQTQNNLLDLDALNGRLPILTRSYVEAKPFPHLILENFLNADSLRRAVVEFPDAESGEWIQYKHVNEKKLGRNKREAIPVGLLEVIDELNSERFVKWLSALTGISNLLPDPRLEGGGLHQIPKGGFLNIHADFTAHAHQPTWARRVNLLLYLNENWLEDYGGHLELWNKNMTAAEQKILPLFNRCVIFTTAADTYHGHPEPTTCPDGITRKSIALYYFTDEKSKPFTRSTEYKSRPQDGAVKSAFIFLDKLALRVYDFAKRRLGFNDALVSKILKRLSK